MVDSLRLIVMWLLNPMRNILMKVTFLLGLMGISLISGSAQATTNDDVNTLNITITNATPNLCTLANYSLKQGEFYFASSIAEYIPPYSSTAPIILNACMSAEIDLSYSCGVNNSITLNTKDISSFWFSNTISADVLSAQNMTAQSRIIKGYYHNAVQWRLGV